MPTGGGGGGGSATTPGGTSGQVQYNNSGAFGGFTTGGDGTLVTSSGALTVTKTNGSAFAASATTDTTNAANISSGTLVLGRGGTGATAANVFYTPNVSTLNASAGGGFIGSNNVTAVVGFFVPYTLVASNITVNVTTSDAGNNYDLGIYNAAGTLVAHTGAMTFPSTGFQTFAFTGGSATFVPGNYWWALTGVATTAKFGFYNNGAFVYASSTAVTGGATSGGVLNGTITPPSKSIAQTNFPEFALS